MLVVHPDTPTMKRPSARTTLGASAMRSHGKPTPPFGGPIIVHVFATGS